MNLDMALLASPLIIDEHNLRLRRARGPSHIQIVDDDEVTQHLVQMMLARDYHVTVSDTPADAVQDYARVTPDLVFLDINLGDAQFDGFSVLHRLQLMDWDANIVMLSGNYTEENVIEAVRKGAMGFVPKPFSKEKLFRFVRDCEQRKGTSWN